MALEVRTDKVRFGVFEADLRSGELRKYGIRIHLQRQPFKILAVLLERPGELVTREELRQRIWPETAVDIDHSLGTSINKLREALNDSADTPQFIETLPKRGFRFIAPVTPIVPPESKPEDAPAPLAAAPAASEPAHSASPLRRRILFCSFGLVAACVFTAWLFFSPQAPVSEVVHFQKVTSVYPIFPGQTDIERFPGVATDGVRVFFPAFENGRVGLSYVLVGGGQVHRFATPPEITRPSVADISRDGSELLIRSTMWQETEQPLWIAPSTGGSARKFFGIMAHDAAWAPDSKTVLYASGQDLWLAARSDGRSFKLATLPGRAYWLRYAPDGSAIRFTVVDPKTRATSLWEISSKGKNLHPLLPGWSSPAAECCGNWTPDGAYFIFQSAHGGRPNIWGLREPQVPWKIHRVPFEITSGPLDFVAPVPTFRGDQLFCIGANTRRELFHFDPATRQAEPYLNGIRGACRPEHAHQGSLLAWISTIDGSLWRGRENGSDQVELVAPPFSVYMERWSPDDRRLVVMAKSPGSPYKIYTVSAEGGDLQPLLNEPRNQADPDWGPDGTAVVFGRLPDYAAEAALPKDIRIFDLLTKTVSILPESTGMFSPRWSPDGRYIAAMTLDQHRLMIFDRTTSTWSLIAQGVIHNPVWSQDGKELYFQQIQEDQVPIYRVSVTTRKLERIFDRNISTSTDSMEFWGLAPDGGPVGTFLFWSSDVYRIKWRRGE
jgi:Tol biopolymer transport system component/DNA-binding winged helix-turn-helix (wHTH) protein